MRLLLLLRVTLFSVGAYFWQHSLSRSVCPGQCRSQLGMQIAQHVPEFQRIVYRLWAVSGLETFCLGIFWHFSPFFFFVVVVLFCFVFFFFFLLVPVVYNLARRKQ